MKRMAWFEIAGLAAVGGLGAFAFAHFNRQPRAGDVALVNAASVRLAVPNQASQINLKDFAPTGVLRVNVGLASDKNAISGTIDNAGGNILPGVVIPVTFPASAIQSIIRNGKVV